MSNRNPQASVARHTNGACDGPVHGKNFSASSMSRIDAAEQAPICYRMHPDKRMLSNHLTFVNSGQCSVVRKQDNAMPPCLLSEQQHSVIDIGGTHRVALMITPQNQGATIDQAWEAISTIRVILNQQPTPMKMVQQSVFVSRAEDIPAIRRLFEAYFGDETPGTSYIVQPSCGGQSLAIEAWAIGGDGVSVQFQGADVVTVDYDAMRWLYLSGITPPRQIVTAYDQSEYCFAELDRRLHRINASFADVSRVWLYQGNITTLENHIERYRELNRARSDYFESQARIHAMRCDDRGVIYPASTGIGTRGPGLVLGAMALQTQRDDIHFVALENPGQKSAYDYERKFSAKSPKFSRATAVITPDYATLWISGTASILDSETVHPGDIEKQTHQTIDNIEQLINEDNLSRHGFPGCGATLKDLAKVRVYVKSASDYAVCRAVCDARFGTLPIVYAFADVCRPDLLVEIEGVAFTDTGKGMKP